jgi:hypothetical protein
VTSRAGASNLDKNVKEEKEREKHVLVLQGLWS